MARLLYPKYCLAIILCLQLFMLHSRAGNMTTLSPTDLKVTTDVGDSGSDSDSASDSDDDTSNECESGSSIQSGCNITHNYFSRNPNGSCSANSYCHMVPSCKPRQLDPESRCHCRVFGEPNYVTFDGQIFHFSGRCAYILAQSLPDLQCQFQVIGINGKSSYNGSQLDAMEVRANEITVLLGHDHMVKVNGELVNLPLTLADGSKIYNTGTFVRYESEKCSLRVEYDGYGRGGLSVPKETHSEMVEGACGNCDDDSSNDFLLRDGTDVSSKVNRVQLMLNSWVSSAHVCNYSRVKLDNHCEGDSLFAQKVNTTMPYCGMLQTTANNSLTECNKKLTEMGTDLLGACYNEMCTALDEDYKVNETRCHILETMEELCASIGVQLQSDWRDDFHCLLSCGENQEMSQKAPTCPETCESHFFGTNPVCSRDLAVSGCVCQDGYVLDGTKCVKPNQCRCLDSCENEAGDENCKLWAQEGHCMEFYASMSASCSKACGFCKPKKSEVCVDRASHLKCDEFRARGLCSDEFYRFICGVTCNPEQCPCQKKKIEKGVCSIETKTLHVNTTSYSLVKGNCVGKSQLTTEACGDCTSKEIVETDNCNVCTGQQTQVTTTYSRDKTTLACNKVLTVKDLPCKACDSKQWTEETCKNDYIKLITTYKHAAEANCTKCVNSAVTVGKVIKCNSLSNLGQCDINSCLQSNTVTTFKTGNCACVPDQVTSTSQTCCCKPKPTRNNCENGCMVTYTYGTGQLQAGQCEYAETVKKTCPDLPKPKLISAGVCDPVTSTQMDSFLKFRMDNCQMVNYTELVPTACTVPCVPSSSETCLAGGLVQLNKVKCSSTNVTSKSISVPAPPKCPLVDPSQARVVCDPATCQAVVFANYSLIDDKCACTVAERQVRNEQCCCDSLNKQPAVTTCENDDTLEQTKTIYEVVQGKCQVKREEKRKIKIDCQVPEGGSSFTKDGVCDGGFQKSELYEAKLSQCKCKKTVTKSTKACKLVCPEPTVTNGTCDPDTCRQTVSTVTYRADGLACNPWTSTTDRYCCAPKPIVSVNMVNCQNLTTVTSYQLNELSGSYDTSTNTTTTNLLCPTKPDIKRGECDQKTGKQKVTTRTVMKNCDTFTCDEVKTQTEVDCLCPKPKNELVDCHNNYVQLYNETTYTLLDDTCVASSRLVPQPLADKPDEPLGFTCDENCNELAKSTVYKVNDCNYTSSVESKPTGKKCCCTDLKFDPIRTCVNNATLKLTTGNYSLVDGTCKLESLTALNSTSCDVEPKTAVGKCDLKTCQRVDTVTQNATQDCACVALAPVKKSTVCCCPEPSSQTSCIGGKNITMTTKYVLVNDQCVATIEQTINPIVCLTSTKVSGQCHEATLQRIVTSVNYTVDPTTCICKENKNVSMVDCGNDCAVTNYTAVADGPDYVKISKISSQKVLDRITDSFVCNKTTQMVTRLFVGATCPEPEVSHTCLFGVIDVTTTTFYQAIPRYNKDYKVNYTDCQSENKLTSLNLTLICQNNDYWTDCIGNKRDHIIETGSVTDCVCKMTKSVVSSELCGEVQTMQKNTCDEANNELVYSKFSLVKNSQGTVVKSTMLTEEKRKVQCDSPVSVTSHCDELLGFGVYQNTTTSLSEISSCKCLPATNFERKLCGCKPSEEYQKCKNGFTNAITRVTYSLIPTKCVRTISTHEEPVQCPADQVTVGDCNQNTCLQEVTWTKNFIHDCKCSPEVHRSQLACCCSAGTEAAARAGKCATNSTCLGESTLVTESCSEPMLITRPFLVFPGVKNAPNVTECKREFISRFDRILCSEQKSKSSFCNKDQNTEVIAENKWRPIACQCQLISSVQNYIGCSCRNNTIDETACVNGFKNVTVTRYPTLDDGTCSSEIVSVKSVPCTCPPPKTSVRCFGGMRITSVTTSMMIGKRCQQSTKEVSEPMTKMPLYWEDHPHRIFDGACIGGKRAVTDVLLVPNNATCMYDELVTPSEEICNCPACFEAPAQCSSDGKKVVSMQTCYELQNGKCVPVEKEIVEDARLGCSKEKVINTTACVNMIKNITEISWFLGSNCQCQRNVSVTQIPCNCELSKELIYDHCKEATNIRTQKFKRYVLVGDKCMPYNQTVTESWDKPYQGPGDKHPLLYNISTHCETKTCQSSYEIKKCSPKNCSCNFLTVDTGTYDCCLTDDQKTAIQSMQCTQEQKTNLVGCFGIQVDDTQPCDQETLTSPVSLVKQVRSGCQCSKQVISTTYKVCDSLAKSAEPHNLFSTRILPDLGNATECVENWRERPKDCSVLLLNKTSVFLLPSNRTQCSAKSTELEASSCRFFETNQYKLTFEQSLNGDNACITTKRLETCKCACQDKNETICDRSTGIMSYVTTTYDREFFTKTCDCKESTNRKDVPLQCDETSPSVELGDCIKGSKHWVQNETTVESVADPYHCDCLKRTTIRQRYCKVDPEEKQFVYWSENYEIRETWENRLNKNGIIFRFLKLNETKLITCPEATTKVFCEPNVSIGVKNVTTFIVAKGVCVPRVKKILISCMCSAKLVPVSETPCDNSTCIKVVSLNQEVFINSQCNNQTIKKDAVCCCPANTSKIVCQNEDTFMTTVTSNTLANGACAEQISQSSQQVTCLQTTRQNETACVNSYKTVNTYGFKPVNCKCEEYLVSSKQVICSCPETTETAPACDASNKQFTSSVTNHTLGDKVCITSVTQKTRPITCLEGTTENVGACNTETRKRNTTTITVELTSDCRCVSRKTLKSTTCACPKPESFVTCPDLTYKTNSVITYNLNADTCTKVVANTSAPIICQGPMNWTVAAGSPNCGQVVYERYVVKQDSCDCARETEVRSCRCDCSKQGGTTCSSDGLNLITTTYSGMPADCNCQFSQVNSSQPVILTCPAANTTRGECNKQTCLRSITATEYSVSNCSCIAQNTTTQEICCCPVTSSANQCVNSTVFRTSVDSYRLKESKCIRSTNVTDQPVACESDSNVEFDSNKCVAISACDPVLKTATYECSTKKIQNCQCVDTKVQIVKNCACPLSTGSTFGECDKTTCLQEERMSNQTWNSVNATCAKKTFKRMVPCCCQEKPSSTGATCQNGRIISTQVVPSWNDTTRKCMVRKIQRAVSVQCRVNVVPVCNPNTCDESSWDVKMELNKQNCTCSVLSRTPITRKCCCKMEADVTAGCSDQNTPTKIITKQVLDKGECVPVVKVQNAGPLTCPSNRVEPELCDMIHCTQAIKSTSWLPSTNCTCSSSVSTTLVPCCTPVLTGNSTTCDTTTGEIVTTYWTQSFDSQTGWSSKSASVRRILDCPQPTIEVNVACSIQQNGRLYEKVTRTTSERNGCDCKIIKLIITRPCKCVDTSSQQDCDASGEVINTYNMTETLSMDKTGSSTCTSNKALISSDKVTCSKPVVTKGNCIAGYRKYTVTTYSSVNCVCTPSTRTVSVQCSCDADKTQTTCDWKTTSVTVTKKQLQCNGADSVGIPDCKCSDTYDSTDTPNKRCPDSQVEEGDCVKDLMSVSTTTWTFDRNTCDCASTNTNSTVSCVSTEEHDSETYFYCSEVVSSGGCLDVNKASVCARSCRMIRKKRLSYRYKQKTIRSMAFKSTVGADLNVFAINVTERNKVLLDKQPLVNEEDCREQCQKNNLCQSMAIDYQLKACRFYSISTVTLKMIGVQMPLVYRPGVVFVEFRNVSNGCPSSTIVEVGSPSKVNLIEGTNLTLCMQLVNVTTYKPTMGSSECDQENYLLKVRCNSYMKLSPKVCADMKADLNAAVAAKDQASQAQLTRSIDANCTVNDTTPCKSQLNVETCNGQTKLFERTHITEQMDKWICVVSVGQSSSSVSCDPSVCPRTKTIVGECVEGRRKIFNITYDSSRGCATTTSETISLCDGCCPGKRHNMTDCLNGQRELSTVFEEKSSQTGLCEQRRVLSKVDCSDQCPVDDWEMGICNYGKREVTKNFYVGLSCMIDRYTDEESCSVEL